MKKASFICVLFLSLIGFSSAFAQSVPSATEVMNEAKVEASAQHKNIFIIFHASWCVWCHRMDSCMTEETFKPMFAENYVIRHLTVDESKGKEQLENPGADAFRAKYDGDKQGIPFWLIFDATGNLLEDSKGADGNNIGCPARPEEVDYFINILKKTSKLNQNQLEQIRQRFLKNA